VYAVNKKLKIKAIPVLAWENENRPLPHAICHRTSGIDDKSKRRLILNGTSRIIQLLLALHFPYGFRFFKLKQVYVCAVLERRGHQAREDDGVTKQKPGTRRGETEAHQLCVARHWKVPFFLFLVRGCEHGLALAAAASISWVRCAIPPSVALFEQRRAEQSKACDSGREPSLSNLPRPAELRMYVVV